MNTKFFYELNLNGLSKLLLDQNIGNNYLIVSSKISCKDIYENNSFSPPDKIGVLIRAQNAYSVYFQLFLVLLIQFFVEKIDFKIHN